MPTNASLGIKISASATTVTYPRQVDIGWVVSGINPDKFRITTTDPVIVPPTGGPSGPAMQGGTWSLVPRETVTITVTVTNVATGLTASDSITITVNVPITFIATPTNAVCGQYTLSWVVGGSSATAVAIDQGVGAVGLTGSQAVVDVSGSITYTLTATTGVTVNTATVTLSMATHTSGSTSPTLSVDAYTSAPQAYPYSTLVDASFVHANTSVGAPGNTTSVPGWTDVIGNTWKINSNNAQGQGPTPNLSPPFPLVRPEMTTDARVLVDIPANSWGGTSPGTNTTGIAATATLRYQAGAGDCYFADLLLYNGHNQANQPPGIVIEKTIAGVNTVLAALAVNVPYTDNMQLWFQAVGTNPTRLSAGFIDLTTGICNAVGEVTDSSATLQQAGQWGIGIVSGTGGPVLTMAFSRARLYSIDYPAGLYFLEYVNGAVRVNQNTPQDWAVNFRRPVGGPFTAFNGVYVTDTAANLEYTNGPFTEETTQATVEADYAGVSTPYCHVGGLPIEVYYQDNVFTDNSQGFPNPTLRLVGPSPIVALSASPSTIYAGNSSTLTWTSNSSTQSIDHGIGNVGSSGTQSVSPTTTTTYTLTGVTDGFTSPTAPATVTVITLPAPINVIAAGACSSIVLAWSMPAGAPSTSFNVRRSTDGVTYSTIATPSGLTYTDTSGTPWTTYYYEIQAVNNAVTSASSTPVTAQPMATPAAPTLPTITGELPEFLVQATASAHATSYNLYRGTTTGGETLYQTRLESPYWYDVVTGLGATSFFYEFTAVNTCGESARSAEVAIIPTPASCASWEGGEGPASTKYARGESAPSSFQAGSEPSATSTSWQPGTSTPKDIWQG